jgi:VanZ family protein
MHAFLLRLSPLFKGLSILALVVIAWESLQTITGTPQITHFDKIMHFLAYGVLAGLFRLGWPKVWGGGLFFAAVGFGALIEIAQGTLTDGRTASIADALANSLGALVALFILHFILRRYETS